MPHHHLPWPGVCLANKTCLLNRVSYMILSIIMGAGWRETMWIIELNVAGYHFTREMPDLKRRPFRFSPRNVHWPVLRHSNAA